MEWSGSDLKIALLGPVAWWTPPRHYGPWELVTSLIAEGLATRGRPGIDVTLFATLDSITKAKLEGVCATGYAEDPSLDGRVCEALHVGHVLERVASGEFDVVHNHLDWLPLAFAQSFAATHTKLVTTIHGFSGPKILPAYVHAAQHSSFVSISDSDRSPALEYVATVHHGIDLDALPFSITGGEALVAFGRIHPDKGTHEAIAIARRAQRRLVICGIVQDEEYFRTRVEPHIDGEHVVYLGSVGPERRSEILGASAALLHPIAFNEPFGLSVVEAMACGTPVIAYPRGSMREIIDPGLTGFLVDNEEAAAAVVDQASKLDRATIRRVAERRFSAARMVDDYIAVYERLLTN